ncbi:MAG TPA: hypothetical protein VGB30_02490 [bacterium]
MSRFKIIAVMVILTSMVSIGCSGGSSNVTPQPVEIKVPTGFAGKINMGEPVLVSVSGLKPMENPVIVEILDNSGSMVSKATLTADRNGKINDVIIAYDVGMWETSGDGNLAPGTYEVKVMSENGVASFDFAVAATPTGPCVWASDIDGHVSNAFVSGDPVFVSASGLEPGRNYRIWPTIDRRSWNDGDTFKEWSQQDMIVNWPAGIDDYIEVVADENGEVTGEQLLAFASKAIPGVTDAFDIIVDAEPYGVFNADTDAVDGELPTGVVVKSIHPSGEPIQVQLGSQKDYHYSNEYSVGDEIYIWLNPGVLIDWHLQFITKYIVLHKAIWNDGDPIVDVSEGIEIDPVQDGCTNEGIILAWVIAQLGEYDIILDLNSNGIYDQGFDILDGGTMGPGFKVTATN